MILYDKNGKTIGEIYETSVAPEPEPTPTPPKSGKVIALVVGHDANSKGAYGDMGVSEWDFNSELLNSMLLPSQHVYYLLYRDTSVSGYTNQMIELHERIDSLGCDISIEFHFNAVDDNTVNGNEVLYCSNAGSEIANILDECLDSLPNRDRGTKKVTMDDRGGGFCCRGKSVAIISEPFFGAEQHGFVIDGENRVLLESAYYNFLDRI